VRRGFFSLRRLRWKLTLSYTLVTMVALLALELLLVGALVAFLNSELLPRLIAQQIEDEVAPRLEAHLDGKTPDVEGLREEITSFPWFQGAMAAGPNPSPDGGSLFVVDDRRRLIVSMPRTEGFAEGKRFDARRIEGLAPLVDAALNGEQNSGRLSANTPGGRLLTVTPLEGRGGRLAGLLVGTLRMPDLTGPLLVSVGASAVALTIPAGFLGAIFGFLTAWGLTRRLGRLESAARAWSQGDFSVVVRDRSEDELGQLSRKLNDMAAQLENLVQTRQELATLEARNRFARDLHDSVKQQVFATSLEVATARALIESDAGAAEAHLANADELVRQAQRELNALIQEMRPAALEGRGLPGALRDYVGGWSRRVEIPAEVHVRGEREVPLEVEQALFRVAQEALSNAARHSGATRVEMDLIYTADTLTLRVADDGRGFDPAWGSGEGFGLQSMRERAAGLGGRVEIRSTPGEGTRIECVCPLPAAALAERKGRRG
jgi:two-component system, NarL family, sensor histidine kinase LiaS